MNRFICYLLIGLFMLPTSLNAAEVCFPVTDGVKMLKAVEQGENCKATIEACENANESCEDRATVLEGRVVEQDKEIQEGKKTIEDTRKAGQEAVKVAAGPWYQQILSAAKWIGLGLLVGFALGASK